ncbi:radical SAM protein, putative [Plasmodium sp. gorilla clade G3]|nr:radical SAM protein, putative [Plasmodium sp. gorilla clade G3]
MSLNGKAKLISFLFLAAGGTYYIYTYKKREIKEFLNSLFFNKKKKKKKIINKGKRKENKLYINNDINDNNKYNDNSEICSSHSFYSSGVDEENKYLLDEIMKLHESSISYITTDSDVDSNKDYKKIKNEQINKNIDIFNNNNNDNNNNNNNLSSGEDSISDVEDINNLNERTNYKFVQMKNKKYIINKQNIINKKNMNNSNNINYSNNYMHDKKKKKTKEYDDNATNSNSDTFDNNNVIILPENYKIYFKSFGCAHNSSDSEFMMGLLANYGFKFVKKIEECDICIVNSCTVKNPSEESMKTIINYVKKLNNNNNSNKKKKKQKGQNLDGEYDLECLSTSSSGFSDVDNEYCYEKGYQNESIEYDTGKKNSSLHDNNKKHHCDDPNYSNHSCCAEDNNLDTYNKNNLLKRTTCCSSDIGKNQCACEEADEEENLLNKQQEKEQHDEKQHNEKQHNEKQHHHENANFKVINQSDDLHTSNNILENSKSEKNKNKKIHVEGKNIKIIVCGCVPQAEKDMEVFENVSLVGVNNIDKIVDVVENVINGYNVQYLKTSKKMTSLNLPKIRKNKYIEIININNGCLGNCTYCKTKFARGDLSSYNIREITDRITYVCNEENIKEIWLTSEDTGAYGIDINTDIVNLLKHILKSVEHTNVMIRLGMTNPPYILKHIKDICTLLKHKNMYEFIHIPVQSGSNNVLKNMKREYTIEDFIFLVENLRRYVSNITISTDIICGFPYETEQDHQNTVDLIKTFQFPILNISQFYPRKGTVAYNMKKINTKIVKKRSRDVTDAFLSYEHNYQYLQNTIQQVLFTEISSKSEHLIGHTKQYVKVLLPNENNKNIQLLGNFATCKILSTHKWHVFAELNK